MSIPVELVVWSSAAQIMKAVEAAPARNSCSSDRAMLVAAYLAFRHKDAKGYVDDAVQQISDAVGFDARRALSVLNMAGVWTVVRRGNQRASTRRRPGPVLTARGAPDSAGGAQAPPAPQSAGGANQSARGAEGSAGGAQVFASTPVPLIGSTSPFITRRDPLGARSTNREQRADFNGARGNADTDPQPITDTFRGWRAYAAAADAQRAADAEAIRQAEERDRATRGRKQP